MSFTSKEIQLASDMKEYGLEWEPKIGDWYDFGKTQYLVVPDGIRWTNYYCYLKPTKEYEWKSSNKLTWLPLWHQCREILSTQNVQVTLTARVDSPVENYVLSARQGNDASSSANGTSVERRS